MKDRLVKQVVIVVFFRLLLNTTRRFVYPFAPALCRSLDVPLAAITTIIATGQLTSLLGLFSGPIAEKKGYRFMMRAGLAFSAVGMLICGLVPEYWFVFVGLVLASFGKTVFDPAIQAFIGKNVPYERRGRIIGLVETAWAASTLIGIPALGLIIQHIGLRSSFFILAFLGAVSWFCIGWTFSSDIPKQSESRVKKGVLLSILELLKVRSTAGMLAFGFWISIANDALFVVYGSWFEQDFGISLVALGFTTVAIGAAELLGEFSTSMFSDKIGLKKSIIIGLCLVTLAYLMLPIIGSTLSLAMMGMFFVFLAFEFTIVTSFSLSTELMPESRATMMAGFYASSGVGRMLGVLLGGGLWAAGGIKAVTWSAAIFTIFGLLSLVWGLSGWQRKEVVLCEGNEV